MMTERMCETLLENTAEIVLRFDEKGNIYYGNRSALEKLEYSKESLREQNMCEFFRQEFQEKGGLAVFDVEILKKTQETVMYREKTSCFPVELHIGEIEPGMYFLLAQDITWKKDTELRIRQIREEQEANLKMRNEFTANVTHELRTPVNGIRGHAMSLLEQPVTPEQKKALDIIVFCCSNMSSIINNILDFSKMEADKFILEDRKFDFYQMMDQVVVTHMTEINKKELGIKVSISENVPRYVIGDSLRIGQILNNLLSNAVKFTKVGRITVDVNKTYQSDDVVELFFMVRDTGIGINKEDQDKLFNSFQQVDASVTRNFGGTGLGLYITRQLVEMMRGSIWIESEKGKGSCFSFNIKLRIEQGAEEEGGVHTAIQNSWNHLVDEEEDIDELYLFGSRENRREITRRMEKLVLSVELGSWDKAEMLTDTIKALLGEQEGQLKRRILRMEMAIRKEDYEKSMDAYQKLKADLDEMLANKTD